MTLRKLNFYLRPIYIGVITISLFGCGGLGKKLKTFLGGKTNASSANSVGSMKSIRGFKNSGNVRIGPDRKYNRMTKKKLRETSALSERSGSLWVMEGQGAYLFSQNIIRMIGDSIAIKIEGDPKQQLESKVKIIKKLLAKLRQRRQARARKLASQPKGESGKKGKKKKNGRKKAPAKSAEDKELEDAKLSVKTVPSRIIERMVDGNYRIKGSQPFLIGNREYKAIVTGVVRAEDFSEDGINASKLIDSKFDIVSVRKKRKL